MSHARRLVGPAVLLLLAVATPPAAAAGPPAKDTHVRLGCSGTEQVLVVPDRARSASFRAVGASGGAGRGGAAGRGAVVQVDDVPVTPGTRVRVTVGCAGGDRVARTGGFPDGQPGGQLWSAGGGGGSTSVDVPDGDGERHVVAAGGGGGARARGASGGDAGVGADGAPGSDGAGGAGGSPWGTAPARAGAPDVLDLLTAGAGGGGGGGGYVGEHGATRNDGGGAGWSFADGPASFSTAGTTGHGYVLVDWRLG